MNWPLYRSLHARGLDQHKLAERTGLNRSVLARILTNEPGRGRETRSKLFTWLIPAEIELLGWTPEYREWLKQFQGGTRDGGQVTGTAPGQCSTDSTGNNVPLAASGLTASGPR